jgi:outer membrane protein assembly factor BamA
MQAEVELTNPDLASDFDYRRAVVDVRRYQPLNQYVNFDTRVRVGNSEGTLPIQKRFYLGGPSSLPGFGLKSFSGQEFALLNTELRFHDEYHRGHWFMFDLSLFIFADIGMATDQSLVDLESNEWANDVGVGVSTDEGNVRLQVAKRTDTSDDPYTFMLRIARPF